MDVSIIIVNYRSWKPLQECLESILSLHTNLLFEVIILDNFSDDNQFNLFKDNYIDFIFIKKDNNSGYSNACNLGAKKATGDYLLFLNPDTKILANTLDTFYTTYQKHPEIGILSCLQVDKKNRPFNQKNIFPTIIHGFGVNRFFYKFLFQKKIEKKFTVKDDLFYPDWVTGAVIFISRDWFKKINGWNEDYWLYFEDVDICKKIIQNNGKVAVTQNTIVLHEHGGSSRSNFEIEHISKTEVIISKHVYINTNFSPLTKIPSHTLLLFFILSEKTILSLLSIILFTNLKLKTNRFILKNLYLYYFNAVKKQTWLSPRSTNYQKINP
jgi:GT2 family glycosyltransferase